MATNTYKCTVCKRQVERVENVYGLDTFSKCVITNGCRGKMRKIGRNLDNIRESFPKFEANLEDYAPRNSFYQHKQTISTTTWLVEHGLNCDPAITVYVAGDDGKYSPLVDTAYTVTSISRTISKLVFPVATDGVVHFNARSSSGIVAPSVSRDSLLTQVTVGGSFVFAFPKLITKTASGQSVEMDLNAPIGDIRLEVVLERPNQEAIYCFEKISGMFDVTPWSGINEILVGKRKNYYLKSKNLLKFTTFGNPDIQFSDIPEGTRLRFTRVDYGTGVVQHIEAKSVLLLLSSTPYEFTDKVRNKLLDLGELLSSGKFLTYSDGEFRVDSSVVEKTYPPIEVARVAGVVPPLPSPTPTPTVSPTISVTPTLTVTPTVTRTATPTPTPTPSITESVTPTPGSTVTPTPTETVTPTPTISVTPSITESVTPTPTISVTPSITESVTPTPASSVTPTITITPTISVTPSITESVTPTPASSVTPTITESVTPTPSVTPSPSVAGDPYGGTLVAQLNMDGTNGSTTINDGAGKTWSTVGSSVISTAQAHEGQSLFVGNVDSGAGVYSLAPTDSLYTITGNFVASARFYMTGNTEFNFSSILAKADTSNRTVPGATMFEVGVNLSGGLYYPTLISFNTSTNSYSAQGSETISLNTWNHVELTRVGNTVRLFVNGVLSLTQGVVGATVANSNKLTVGCTNQNGANYRHALRGYIDNVFIAKDGTGYHTTSFTPPSPTPTPTVTPTISVTPTITVTPTISVTPSPSVPSGFRYWRVYMTANNGGSRAHVAEMEMRASPGGADQCNGGTAYASTVDAGSSADFAFANDGTTTGWNATTTGFPQWLAYDFGAGNNKNIAEITMQVDTAFTERAPRDFTIQSSNDNVTWNNVKSYTGETFAGAVRTFSTTTLRDEILGDSPSFYYPMNETSGTNANNETGGTDATYLNGPTLNQPAIYNGGPVSMRLTQGSQLLDIPSSVFSAPTSALTMGLIIKPQSVSGFNMLLSKDPASSREWQWRMNGVNMEWVKINGGVETIVASNVFTLDVACIVHVVINGTSIVMYKNGVAVLTTTIGSGTYGNLPSNLSVGYQAGPGTGTNAFVSEAYGYASALSAARILAHAKAAGFAV